MHKPFEIKWKTFLAIAQQVLSTEEYLTLLRKIGEMCRLFQEISEQCASLITASQLRLPEEYKHISIAYMSDYPTSVSEIEFSDRIEYKEFTINKTVFFNIVKPAVWKCLEDGIAPVNFRFLAIGEELLNKAVIHGRLPRTQFSFRAFGFECIYAPSITGMVIIP